MALDPHWPRASGWLGAGHVEPRLSVVGAPFNRSVTPGHYDHGPDTICKILDRYSDAIFAGGGSLYDIPVRDFGDVDVDEEDWTVSIPGLAEALQFEAGVILGGDNGATRAGVHALAQARGIHFNRIGLITLDAHLDVRDLDGGAMNGNPIRGLLEDGMDPTHIVQIGLQDFANSSYYMNVGLDAGIRAIPLDHRSLPAVFEEELGLADRVDALYVDFDLDVMDRAFVPGCPGARPGGITPREARQIARIAGRSQVAVMDFVEFDPSKDVNDQTALIAAACLLEFAAGLAERS